MTKTTTGQMTISTISRPTVPRMPRMEVYERMLSGTNDNGMKIRNERSFQAVVEMSGINALSESANNTTSATLNQLYKR